MCVCVCRIVTPLMLVVWVKLSPLCSNMKRRKCTHCNDITKSNLEPLVEWCLVLEFLKFVYQELGVIYVIDVNKIITMIIQLFIIHNCWACAHNFMLSWISETRIDYRALVNGHVEWHDGIPRNCWCLYWTNVLETQFSCLYTSF